MHPLATWRRHGQRDVRGERRGRSQSDSPSSERFSAASTAIYPSNAGTAITTSAVSIAARAAASLSAFASITAALSAFYHFHPRPSMFCAVVMSFVTGIARVRSLPLSRATESVGREAEQQGWVRRMHSRAGAAGRATVS